MLKLSYIKLKSNVNIKSPGNKFLKIQVEKGFLSAFVILTSFTFIYEA